MYRSVKYLLAWLLLALPLVGLVAQPAVGNSVTDLKKLLGIGAPEDSFLNEDDAFAVQAIPAPGGDAIRVIFEIAEGYYLYRSKMGFTIEGGTAALSSAELPPGEEKTDEYFGLMEIYHGRVEINLPLERAHVGPEEVILHLAYQGCAEAGICYPPIKRKISLTLPPVEATASAPVDPEASEETGSFLVYMLAAFGAGLLLTFTPCVLPMIPILSSVIVGQGERLTRARGGALSIVYVLGTAATYTVAGVVAGLTGEQLQAYFQNIWAIGGLSLLFVIMALSMFGLYDLQMPSTIQSRLEGRTRGMGGSYSMVFFLGALSALIVGACVSPVLIAVLSIAIAAGDPVLGGLTMFSMALGMGLILVVIGFSAGFLIPHAGAWMDRVKQSFGVMLLGVAIYLLGAIPEVPVLLLWGALLIITGVFLGAVQALPKEKRGWQVLWKGVGIVLLIWGVLALVGGFAGKRDILNPLPLELLSGSDPTVENIDRDELFTQVPDMATLERELEAASRNNQPLLLNFYADWCIDCLRMEEATFKDATVLGGLERFVALQVDLTDPGNPLTKEIKRHFGVFGPPAMLFFDSAGEEQIRLRRYGYLSVGKFNQLISQLR
ncbi:MAG: protein-disulfide reductase DsbD [Arenicellales bacterium]|jgi:thiol:disulfide interchange protein DsbD|nr:protein-disulfide reductase DsbD [Arenicellales bacterium]